MKRCLENEFVNKNISNSRQTARRHISIKGSLRLTFIHGIDLESCNVLMVDEFTMAHGASCVDF